MSVTMVSVTSVMSVMSVMSAMTFGRRHGHASRHVTVPWQDSLLMAPICIEWVATSNSKRKLVWVACKQVPEPILEVASKPGRLIKGQDGVWRLPADWGNTGGRVTTVRMIVVLGAVFPWGSDALHVARQ